MATRVFYTIFVVMSDDIKLRLIKIIHTLIWVFFNVVIGYMLYAVITNRLDMWLWIGYGLVLLEGLVLLVFRFVCPLSLLARRYTDAAEDNFDIYLPAWLAKYTKLIYTGITLLIIAGTIYRWVS